MSANANPQSSVRPDQKKPPQRAGSETTFEPLLNDAQAAQLLGNMHPRTLQRRLREEGTSFEDIKDDVRRDAAARYLSQSDIPLTRVAALLGYSESSVLARSCKRWFDNSPRKVREMAGETLDTG